VVLMAAEIVRPRPDFDIRRWSTVFPLGMTAVASLATATAAGVGGLTPLGEVLLWISVVAWLFTAASFVATSARTA
jgi:hypothetical protein